MSRFGTSEAQVFGTQGAVKLIGETEEVCTTCELSANGPHKFGVMRADARSVTLVCPNCGETKTVFPDQVQGFMSPEEKERRKKLQAIADAGRAAAEAEAQASAQFLAAQQAVKAAKKAPKKGTAAPKKGTKKAPVKKTAKKPTKAAKKAPARKARARA